MIQISYREPKDGKRKDPKTKVVTDYTSKGGLMLENTATSTPMDSKRFLGSVSMNAIKYHKFMGHGDQVQGINGTVEAVKKAVIAVAAEQNIALDDPKHNLDFLQPAAAKGKKTDREVLGKVEI